MYIEPKRLTGMQFTESHDANAQFQGKKRWDMPRRGNAEARQINPGDVGIWATCAMKKEAPTVADLRDLFQGVSVIFVLLGHPPSRFWKAMTDGSEVRCEVVR